MRITVEETPLLVAPPLPLDLSDQSAMHGGDCGSKVCVTDPSGQV
jgi:hypothetical protein